jgi:hypothetical protein
MASCEVFAMVEPLKPSYRETVYRLVAAVCFVGTLTMFAMLLLLDVFFGIRTGEFGLLLFVLFGGAEFFVWRAEKHAQRPRDDHALRLLNAAKVGEVVEFAIFLRAFSATGKVRLRMPSHNGEHNLAHYHFEQTLINAFSMPLIALGKPGEVIGAGRVLTDESSWQNIVLELMHIASIIICIPSMRAGSY